MTAFLYVLLVLVTIGLEAKIVNMEERIHELESRSVRHECKLSRLERSMEETNDLDNQ